MKKKAREIKKFSTEKKRGKTSIKARKSIFETWKVAQTHRRKLLLTILSCSFYFIFFVFSLTTHQQSLLRCVWLNCRKRKKKNCKKTFCVLFRQNIFLEFQVRLHNLVHFINVYHVLHRSSTHLSPIKFTFGLKVKLFLLHFFPSFFIRRSRKYLTLLCGTVVCRIGKRQWKIPKCCD